MPITSGRFNSTLPTTSPGNIAGNDILDPSLSDYDFQGFQFPLDYAASDMNHYMIININVPVNRTALGASTNVPDSIFLSPSQIIAADFSSGNVQGLSTIDRLRYLYDQNSAINMFTGQSGSLGSALLRSQNPSLGFGNVNDIAAPFDSATRRLKAAIALFMPANLVYSSVHEYEEAKITNMLARGIGSVVGGAVSGLGGVLSNTIKNLGNAAGIGNSLGNLLSAQNIENAASLSRHPINPRVEVLYSNTQLRQFIFDFLLAPRNEKESLALASIVRTLRFYSAPETDPNTSGFTFIPPASFDIRFYRDGKENTALPRINTCVLNRVEVNYSPNGTYSTFTNGYPVMMTLSLSFMETEILTKDRIYLGY